MKIKDRPEFATKPRVLTMPPATPLREAVAEMCKRRYGSVVVADEDERLVGIVTERDVMSRVVNEGRDADALTLSDIMSTEIRAAKADDDLIDWLRIMSNERFRRLPIVDADGRVVSMMTQGDFVSYTWPDLIAQLSLSARAAVSKNYQIALIAGGIAIYSIVMFVVFSVVL
ncbi:MAG: CBS domain-containing protein [Pseudomonadota bacterium]